MYNGLFPFQVGPTKKGDQLGVVRLGGHREGNESAIETAKREVYEEAQMVIYPTSSSVTYHKPTWGERSTIVESNEGISPVLIKGVQDLSVMYLSYTKSEPQPSSETQGLLLLTPCDVHLICNHNLTLDDYLNKNGTAKLKGRLNSSLTLKPFPQLLFLSWLFKNEQKLMKDFISI